MKYLLILFFLPCVSVAGLSVEEGSAEDTYSCLEIDTYYDCLYEETHSLHSTELRNSEKVSKIHHVCFKKAYNRELDDIEIGEMLLFGDISETCTTELPDLGSLDESNKKRYLTDALACMRKTLKQMNDCPDNSKKIDQLVTI